MEGPGQPEVVKGDEGRVGLGGGAALQTLLKAPTLYMALEVAW